MQNGKFLLLQLHIKEYSIGETQVDFHYEVVTGNTLCLSVSLALSTVNQNYLSLKPWMN